MKSKTALVIETYQNGDRAKALKMAKGFKGGITKEQSKQLVRGFECTHNPRFYEMLGFDPKDEFEKACKIFEQCFIGEEHQVLSYS